LYDLLIFFSLRVRVRLVSPPAVSIKPKTSIISSNACQICHQQFPKRLLYKKHMLTHLGDKHFACTYPVCNYIFSLIIFSFVFSKRHVKIHFILNQILIVMYVLFIYMEAIPLYVHFRIVEKHLQEMIH